MTDFVQLYNTDTKVVDWYPPHFLDHPVFGKYLVAYDPEGYEEEKVTVDAPFSLNRERTIATPIEDKEPTKEPTKKSTGKDEK